MKVAGSCCATGLAVGITLSLLIAPSIAVMVLAIGIGVGIFFVLPPQSIRGVMVGFAVVLLATLPGFTAGLTVAQVVGAFGAGLGIVAAQFRSKHFSTPRIEFYLLSLVYFISFLATAMSPKPDWFFASTAIVVLPAAIVAGSFTPDDRRVLNGMLVTLGLCLSIIAIVECFGVSRLVFATRKTGLSGHAFIDGGVRAEATTGHPLVLGFIILVALLAVLQLRVRMLFLLPAVGLLALGIVATGSASVALVFALTFIMSVVSALSAAARFATTLLALAVAMLLPSVWFMTGIVSQFSGSGAAQRIGSLASVPRILGWQDAPQIIFGNGWGGGTVLFERGLLFASRSKSVDNQLVTTLIEAGIVGLIMLCAALVIASTRAAPSRRLGLAAVSLMFLSFDVLLWSVPALVFAVFLIGARSAPRERNTEPSESNIPMMGRSRREVGKKGRPHELVLLSAANGE